MKYLVLAALAAIPVQDDSVLLPTAPEGWPYERLDFPLSFAPSIELEGFEELYFAPGMFDAESESYFSYVLAIRAEGRHEVDEAFVQDFLEKYYRGLCLRVGEGRGLEVDADAITVHVEPGGHGYRAAVDMIDPFVTGGPLVLDLAISVHARSDATELFAAVSPMGRDEPVWDELAAIGDRWRSARPPAAYLNHVYIVPDEETYRALVESPLLRSLGVFEERTTERPDMTYTGAYVYGENTYFEFLRPDPEIGFGPGGTGVALGLEVPGSTMKVSTRLFERDIRTFSAPTRRVTDAGLVPWFKMMGVERATAESSLSVFTIEYDPAFLEMWHAELAPARPGISRAKILRRYAARLREDDAEPPLLRDIVELHLELDEAERERFFETSRALGYSIEEGEDESICRGPGYRVVVRASKGPGSLKGFVATLARPAEPGVHRFGAIELVLDDHTATFSVREGAPSPAEAASRSE